MQIFLRISISIARLFRPSFIYHWMLVVLKLRWLNIITFQEQVLVLVQVQLALFVLILNFSMSRALWEMSEARTSRTFRILSADLCLFLFLLDCFFRFKLFFGTVVCTRFERVRILTCKIVVYWGSKKRLPRCFRILVASFVGHARWLYCRSEFIGRLVNQVVVICAAYFRCLGNIALE